MVNLLLPITLVLVFVFSVVVPAVNKIQVVALAIR